MKKKIIMILSLGLVGLLLFTDLMTVFSEGLAAYTGPLNRSYTVETEVDRYCQYVYYWNGSGAGCWNGATYNSSCSIHTRDSYVLASICTLDIPNSQVAAKCGCTAPDWKPWNGEPDPKLVRVMDSTTVTYPLATVNGILHCDGSIVNGWCTGKVSVQITGVEPVSGYAITAIESNTAWAESGDSGIYEAVEGTTMFEYWAVSSYGDTSMKASTSLMQDTQPPTYTINAPAANSHAWYKAPITVTITGTDSGSGIAIERITESGSSSIDLHDEGIHNLNYYVADLAGWSSSGGGSFQLDFTQPSLSTSFPSVDGANGWYITSPTISVSGSDVLSGVAIAEIVAYGSNSVTLPDGIYANLEFRVTDRAGNMTAETHSFAVDTSRPELAVTHNALQTLLSGGVVTFSGNAMDGFSGIAALTVIMDGSSQTLMLDASGDFIFPVDFDTLPDGSHTIQFEAQDKAGNKAVRDFTFTRDGTPPITSMPDSWQLGQRISLQASDVTSGLDHCELVIQQDGHRWSQTFLADVDTLFLWDGIYDDGTKAGDGRHAVRLTCTDRAGMSTTVTGTITHPEPPAPTAIVLSEHATALIVMELHPTQTMEPSQLPTLTPTGISSTEAAVGATMIPTATTEAVLRIEIVPTQTAPIAAALEASVPAQAEEEPSDQIQAFLLIPPVGLVLFAMAALALFDPRPPAWHAIADVLRFTSKNKKN